MRIELSGGYHLSGVRESDREAHVRLLADGAIAAFIPAIPSIRLLQKNGFAPEGRLRRFTRTATGLHDLLVFALLRDPRVDALDCDCLQLRGP